MSEEPKPNGSKRHASQQSVNGAVKSICDIMRRSNCAGALQYVPELTWMLFLRILDEVETREAEEAAALGLRFKASLSKPFRWCDWAAPESSMRKDKNASVWKFVHEDLLPKLKSLVFFNQIKLCDQATQLTVRHHIMLLTVSVY